MKGALAMPNHKHLTLDDRSYIHSSLNAGQSFRWIAQHLDKDPSTISKEIRSHRLPLRATPYGRIPNNCIHKTNCNVSGLCGDPKCDHDLCRRCKKCNTICSNYQEERCHILLKAPYVCNGCEQLNKCVLTKYVYRAATADKSYRTSLVSSREGLSYTEDELAYMSECLAPLVKKKQSIHHICVSQADKIICSERTIYKLIGQGVLSIRNIDLPRKVRYRPRQQSKLFKVDKKCRVGRTYDDFQAYIQENPDTPIVQMDSVEGKKGGKVLLTIYFSQSDLMLIYLRDRNTSQSVIDIFNALDENLGRESFCRLFPIILTDNGSEFSNPHAIEYDIFGNQRTRLFYCNPSSPYQKPEIERNHEYIRMVLPKGTSFDSLTQNDVNVLACHMNSLIRKKLNDRSPITAFSFFHGEMVLNKLSLHAILPGDVTLTPALLKHLKDQR
ncbi:IS30 family transposase [Desulforamulus putei]|nr:IS30 family transposase [Desulforamulus putei]